MVSDAFRAGVAGFAWYLYVEHLKVSRLASRWLELHGGTGLWGMGRGALASLWREQVESHSFFHRSSWYLFHPSYNGLKGVHPQTF